MGDDLAAQWPRIRDRLAERFGLYLDDSRTSQGQSLIAGRSRMLNLSPAAYGRLLFSDGGAGELYSLAEYLANHETQFFRNPAHFRVLRDYVFPSLQRDRPALRPIRCWSAGCATGEEAYSIAMTALQCWGAPPTRPVNIWGTDLSHVVLDRARQGLYRGRTLTNVQPSYRPFFEPNGDGLQVGALARSLVQFEQHNLLDPLPPWSNELDVIFCQNVTIYFQLATCKQLIERMYNALSPGGYLLLGFSESLWGIFDKFETVDLDGAFIYRKTEGPPPARPRPSASRAPRGDAPPPAAPSGQPRSPRPAPPVRPVLPVRRPPPVQASNHLETARELRAAGEQRQALALLAQVPPDERSPAVLALSAQLHADLGQREQAAAEARRALELDVMQDAAYLVLGMLELAGGAWLEASRHLERALYLVPQSPTVSFYLAESYRHQGRVPAAQREYRNTLRKLIGLAPTIVLDGVAAGWIQSTCQRWLAAMEQGLEA
ncbi:MAG TPA: CheR family methyltransferase [Herpetosiphonaceae bacterium]|nr:CheR family methyltransferase [Herpetosiphonaceae bacterium]